MSIYSRSAENKNTAKLQSQRNASMTSQDVFSVHPSFTHQYSRSYVTLYKRRPSSFLSKFKNINMSKVGDVIGVLLWAVSIPVVFSLGSIVVV